MATQYSTSIIENYSIGKKAKLAGRSILGSGVGGLVACLFSGPFGWCALAGAAAGAIYQATKSSYRAMKADVISGYLKDSQKDDILKLDYKLKKDSTGVKRLIPKLPKGFEISQDGLDYLAHYNHNKLVMGGDRGYKLVIKKLDNEKYTFENALDAEPVTPEFEIVQPVTKYHFNWGKKKRKQTQQPSQSAPNQDQVTGRVRRILGPRQEDPRNILGGINP